VVASFFPNTGCEDTFLGRTGQLDKEHLVQRERPDHDVRSLGSRADLRREDKVPRIEVDKEFPITGFVQEGRSTRGRRGTRPTLAGPDKVLGDMLPGAGERRRRVQLLDVGLENGCNVFSTES
jgi:hypothetical protein